MAGRGNWRNWYEFLFSCIGCLVGLGNIWRFPYLCYKNGGGAFLIPYFIFMFLCAFPVFFLEMSYAQFSNLGPGNAWICVPLLRGVGYGMVLMTGIVAIYYNVIMAWTLYYFGMSFSARLPWSHCDNAWNTAACYVRVVTSNTSSSSNVTLASYNGTGGSDVINGNNNVTKLLRKTPTEDFWERNVLEITGGVEEPGYVRWQLFLCLFAAWFVVFLCLIKGIKSSGKLTKVWKEPGYVRWQLFLCLFATWLVVFLCLIKGINSSEKVMYVAATVPYLLLLVLLIRGATLEGAWDGFKFYAIPRWEKLLSFSVWGDAAVQMFYSAGMGWGGISTLASYNDFHNNIERDAILLPILDCLTSWFAGCVIFVNLGYMSAAAGVPIDEVVSQGPGIAFMVYPEALSQLPLPQFWSVLFFFMLFTVGLDSQIVHVQTLTSAIMDTFPKQLLKRKLLVTSSVCVTLMLLGVSCITQGGIYFLQIMDWYCASIAVMLLAFLELTGLSWIYGIRRLYRDIELMLGRRLNRIWGVFLVAITPAIVAFIWVFNLAQLKPVRYGDVTYPGWAISIGWIIAFLSLTPLPVCAIMALKAAKGTTIVQKIQNSIQPSPDWKPANKLCQEQYQMALSDDYSTDIKA